MKSRRQVFPALMLVAAMSGAMATAWAQEEPAPTTFVELSYGAACDATNNRLVLKNVHTFKTIAATVRWRAAGGKLLQEQFFPAPSATIEIGCAAEAEVVEAAFADF